MYFNENFGVKIVKYIDRVEILNFIIVLKYKNKVVIILKNLYNSNLVFGN